MIKAITNNFKVFCTEENVQSNSLSLNINVFDILILLL